MVDRNETPKLTVIITIASAFQHQTTTVAMEQAALLA
jgi:hypothetical protein